jgi:hypothetical protein
MCRRHRTNDVIRAAVPELDILHRLVIVQQKPRHGDRGEVWDSLRKKKTKRLPDALVPAALIANKSPGQWVLTGASFRV